MNTPDFELTAQAHTWRLEIPRDNWPIARPIYATGKPASWYVSIDPKLPCPTEIPDRVWADGIEFIDAQPF